MGESLYIQICTIVKSRVGDYEVYTYPLLSLLEDTWQNNQDTISFAHCHAFTRSS